jgi:hypothetical protein
MYSSYHSVVVNNIFAYGPDGKVFLCTINFPSSWHDRSLTTNVFPISMITLDVTKSVQIKVSQGVVMQLGFLLAL